MANPTLKVGSGQYDTTRALFDGVVSVQGFDTQMSTARTLPEIFERMIRDQEFDVAELGLTFLLRALEHSAGELPYVAIPVFPNRIFRHSCIFVNASSGIEGPKDLVGRTIGEFGIYGQDSGVWAKGALMDDYGFRPEQNRWIIGGLDQPAAPFDFVVHPHPSDVEVDVAPADTSLGEMLQAGDIDALFTANVPQCVLDGSPRIKRLFPDFESIERKYHRRTGIFPMMHTVVISRRLIKAHPGVVGSVYEAFEQSKGIAAEHYRQHERLYQVQTMVPWTNALFERNRAEFGDDWWPYGLDVNRTAIDTYLRYHHEQGLSQRRLRADDIFLAVDR
jgi:hypothetical protein